MFNVSDKNRVIYVAITYTNQNIEEKIAYKVNREKITIGKKMHICCPKMMVCLEHIKNMITNKLFRYTWKY